MITKFFRVEYPESLKGQPEKYLKTFLGNTGVKIHELPAELFKEKKENVGGFYGWTCPVCGRGNSPFTTICPCNPLPNTITC